MNGMMRGIALVAGTLGLCVVAAPRAQATTFNAAPGDDVETMINALAAGDELVLADGMYTLDSSRFFINVAGTEALPIVVRAADGARPHFQRPSDSQNIWDIRAEYLVLRGLEFSGGSAGLRFETGRFVTIEACEIHDTGDVALRMNDVGQRYEGMRILRNEIHHTNGTGEGMYLGCNSNGCQLANALIEGNYVHHTNQASVSQGDGIEIKEGSFGNVVRDNVIHDTNYPCILTYSTVGNGAPNVIERNALWNCGDHGIQSAADAVIRNNIILGAVADGIAMQPHQAGTPSNLIVAHNTVLNGGRAITVRGATGSVLVANNALYSQSGEAIFVNGDATMVTSIGNVSVGGGPGVTAGALTADLVMASHAGAPPMNVFPTAGGMLPRTGEVAHVVSDDFDGTARLGVADVGAYAFGPGGPRWILAAGFKSISPGPMPGTDGGVAELDGGGVSLDGGGVSRDGGSTGRDGGGTTGSDGGGAAGGGDDGGCGCTMVGASRGSSIAWLSLALLALIWRRRRASRSLSV